MNYLKLMSILSEADADEYGVATQKKKKDEKDDFHRSKADQAFKDMHKVDVATEKDFETLGPITTKQHGDHKGNPSSINIGDATQQSPLKQFDMGGIGKSSYRKIDKTEGQKAMPKVDDAVTKVLRMREEAESLEEFDKQKLKYDPEKGYNKHQATVKGSNKSSFSKKTKLPVRKTFKDAVRDIAKQNKLRGTQSGYDIHSYKESVNFDATKFGMPKPGEKRWKQTSLSPKEAAAKHGKENVRVQKGRLRNGDDMVEVHVESVEELDELSKTTLGNYIKKSSEDQAHRAMRQAVRSGVAAASGKTPSNFDKDQKNDLKKQVKREVGIHRAVNKLTREEADQLDELSNDTLTRYKRYATNDEVNAVISGDKARASKRRRGKVAAGNAMYNNDQRAFTQRMKDKKMKEEAEIDEAVGTAAKYAHKKGVFGGKYGAKDHALTVSDKTSKKYLDRSRARDKAEHEKQDPRMAKMGYAKHMVDAQKAKKKAKERGVTMPKLKGVNYSEEAEQLDELSPKTLNSYATKAQPDVRRQSLDAAKRKRRAKGVALARFKALRGSE